MASIGHVVVGMAASRFSRHRRPTTWTPFGAAVLWSGLSLLPDADVLGFPLGVHYEDPWGHRGATHSLVFALGVASSHREAPLISADPLADNTDVYAFVSPDKPDTVTLIANFIPLQLPYGGPNFTEFGDDVRYEIPVSNAGDARADVTYQFRFTTGVRNKKTFLYNTGPIEKIDSKNWNRPQFCTVTRVDRRGRSTVLGRNLAVPPVNVGVRSTPHYDATFTAA